MTDPDRRQSAGRRSADNEAIESIRTALNLGDDRMDAIEHAVRENAKAIQEVREDIAEPLEIIMAFKGTARVVVGIGSFLKWFFGLGTAVLLFWIASRDAFKDLFK
jgi:hypothetical protein